VITRLDSARLVISNISLKTLQKIDKNRSLVSISVYNEMTILKYIANTAFKYKNTKPLLYQKKSKYCRTMITFINKNVITVAICSYRHHVNIISVKLVNRIEKSRPCNAVCFAIYLYNYMFKNELSSL